MRGSEHFRIISVGSFYRVVLIVGILMMSVAVFSQDGNSTQWDAAVRQYGLTEVAVVPDGITPISISTVEQLRDLVYEFSLEPVGGVEVVSGSASGASGASSVAASSTVRSNYSCTKAGAISRVKSIVQMTLSLSPTRFKSKGASWYEVSGLMAFHSVRDVQLNNSIKDGGRRLEMRLNFNVYVSLGPLVYTLPSSGKCNHRV